MHNAGKEQKKLEKLEAEVKKLSKIIHGTYFMEYLELVKDTRKLFVMNFLLGLTRGLGMALGFTILGAFVFYILKQIIILNLPLISDFIADIVRLVQEQSGGILID